LLQAPLNSDFKKDVLHMKRSPLFLSAYLVSLTVIAGCSGKDPMITSPNTASRGIVKPDSKPTAQGLNAADAKTSGVAAGAAAPSESENSSRRFSIFPWMTQESQK